MEQDQFSSLIGRIYEAALEPCHWNDVMNAVADALHGTVANVSRYNFATNESNNIAPRVAPEFHRSYVEYFAARNPFVETAMGQPTGRVLSMEECLPRHYLEGTEMYGEWLEPQKMQHGLSTSFGIEGSTGINFAVWRPASRGAFGAEQRALLARIAPHLSRALRLSMRLTEVDLFGAGAASALDLLPQGIALLDHGGAVRFLNKMAEAVTRESDGLSVCGGYLTAAVPRENTQIRKAIRSAIDDNLGCTLQISRTTGRRALTLLSSPLNLDSAWFGLRPPGAIVVISDPEQGCLPPAERLMQAYQLTAAETLVALNLLAGHEIATVADRLRITYETARTHLRRIFSKTGTRRQSELVRKLLREVGAIL
jgi:DNA-binding CsgD family transcriptional regulator/PAS domain-containing protein